MFGANSQSPLKAQAMADDKRKPLVSRTRWVVGLLLMIAIPIFIGLAEKVVHENAAAFQQGFGR